MTYRTFGKKILKKVLKNAININSFEELLFNVTKKNRELYLKLLYQLVYDISLNKSVKQLYIDLMNKNIEWNHPYFSQYKQMCDEQDEFMLKPFEIEEGVLQKS